MKAFFELPEKTFGDDRGFLGFFGGHGSLGPLALLEQFVGYDNSSEDGGFQRVRGRSVLLDFDDFLFIEIDYFREIFRFFIGMHREGRTEDIDFYFRLF